jgi:hypothetical protein
MTAVAACTASIGPGWDVAIEADRPDASTVALVNGDSIAVCETARNASGVGFGDTGVGIGTHPAPSPVTLSYITSGGHDDKPSYLVGRATPSTDAVIVTVEDGSQHRAVLGGGLWLAWLDEPANPTLIEALDASGTVISRLEDPMASSPPG